MKNIRKEAASHERTSEAAAFSGEIQLSIKAKRDENFQRSS